MTEGRLLWEGGIYQDPKEENEWGRAFMGTQRKLPSRGAFPAEELQSSPSTDNSTTQGIWAAIFLHHSSLKWIYGQMLLSTGNFKNE